jgi:hypothetical protein
MNWASYSFGVLRQAWHKVPDGFDTTVDATLQTPVDPLPSTCPRCRDLPCKKQPHQKYLRDAGLTALITIFLSLYFQFFTALSPDAPLAAHSTSTQKRQFQNMSTTIIKDLLDELAAAAPPDSSAEPQTKRNSGRTGPTSTAGRCISSQNARTHGACSTTLILPDEREEDWLILLSHWLETYQQTSQDSLLYDFVLKTAQADWFRQRNQNHYDDYLQNLRRPPCLSLNARTNQNARSHAALQEFRRTCLSTRLSPS